MGQSLVKNYIHIIFSTKHRKPTILPAIEKELHSYIGSLCKKFDSPVLIVGGYNNHIHILCSLSKNIALASMVAKIKGSSSKWIKTKGEEYSKFYWQDGYGAFSVRPSDVGIVESYIARQHEHHKKKTYKTEFRSYLEKYHVTYDENYIWD